MIDLVTPEEPPIHEFENSKQFFSIRHAYWLAITVFLQVVAVIGLASSKIYALQTGTHVTLNASTMIRRDKFRGDYIEQLTYRPTPTAAEAAFRYRRTNAKTGFGFDGFALFKKNGDVWEFEGITTPLPKDLEREEVAIKTKYSWSTPSHSSSKIAGLYLDVDPFFIQESPAEDNIQQRLNHSEVSVDLLVDKTGRARLLSMTKKSAS